MSELSSVHIHGLADLASAIGKGQTAGKLRHAATQGKEAAVRAARDFESIFLHKLLQEMKDTIPDGGLLGDGASDQVKDIFWFYLAQELADKGGLGLWKQIYRQAGLGRGQPPDKPTVEQML